MQLIKRIQQGLAEVGRIRIGDSVEKERRDPRPGQSATYHQPRKSESFIFSTPSRVLADWVAAAYGGEVEPWTPQNTDSSQFRVVTKLDEIRVIIPPVGTLITQWYEMWEGRRAALRCDGETEVLGDRPCVCGPRPTGPKQCKPITRVNLMLVHPETDEIPSIGVWRLDTKGYYAATHIPAQAQVIQATNSRRAFLRLVEKSKGVFDETKQKTITTKWYEPSLDLPNSTGLMLTGTNAAGLAIEAGPATDETIVDAETVADEPDDRADGDDTAAAAPVVPEVEVIARIEKIDNDDDLRAAYNGIKEKGWLTNAVTAAIVARKKALDEAARKPAAAPVATPAAPAPATEATARVTDNAEQVWMECVTLAGKLNPPWDSDQLMRKFKDKFKVDVFDGTLAQYTAYRDQLAAQRG